MHEKVVEYTTPSRLNKTFSMIFQHRACSCRCKALALNKGTFWVGLYADYVINLGQEQFWLEARV